MPADALRPHVDVYTDGACIHNPGPGGYGVVLVSGEHRKELSGGFRLTTNNRMELTAAIEGLRALRHPSQVTLHSDSQYLVNSMNNGSVRKWQANGWRKPKGKGPVLNPDLWEQLLQLCDEHEVEFVWLRGHAGDKENERCDELAMQAAVRDDLPADEGYEAPAQTSLFRAL
jgi:ribonuclease HI